MSNSNMIGLNLLDMRKVLTLLEVMEKQQDVLPDELIHAMSELSHG